ncbi:MAG: dTDP-4-dehydrorhamnose reductase, partial [Acidobacteriota bacterium]
MKTLITGSKGQLGFELMRTKPAHCQIHAHDVDELDITDLEEVRTFVSSLKPDVIINAAAYTAVDRAETEKETAFLINAKGPGNLAMVSREVGARIIHISTDFVFDGELGRPYRPDVKPNPVSAYGESKLAGETEVLSGNPDRAVIVRTSWLYSLNGNNFVKTMINLMKSRPNLRVVADQIGSPTWAKTLAEAIWEFARNPELIGIYHWADSGVASWYDFAVAIMEEALQYGLLERPIPVHPIPSSE